MQLRPIAILALSLSAASAAQQPGQVNVFGLDHTPLGQATLQKDPLTGNCVVANIGSSGLDGVSIKCDSGDGWDGYNLPATLSTGGMLRYDFIGSDPATGTSGNACSIRATEQGGQYSYDMDFPGSTSVRIEAYLDGRLVYEKSNHTGGDFWPLIVAAALLLDGHLEYSEADGWSGGISFGSMGGTTVQVAGPGGALVFCDLVRVRPEPQAVPYTQFERVELRMAGLTDFTFENERLVRFGNAHEALGQATFSEATGGGLQVSNLGSSGLDGFSTARLDYDGDGKNDFAVWRSAASGGGGSTVEITGAGSIAGTPSSTLGSVRQTSNGQSVVHTADFSAVGISSQVVEVWDRGALVASFPGHSGPIARTSGYARGSGVVRWSTGSTGSSAEPCTWVLPFDAATQFVMGGSATGASALGDELRIRPAKTDSASWTLEKCEVRTTGIQSLTITDEQSMPSPFFETYCVAKTNSLGCTPAISASGIPSASATSGFTVTTTQVRNNKAGLYFYTVNKAQTALPFQCGTLCVGPSGIKRTPAQSSGGNPAPAKDCSGAYSLDFNCFGAGLCGGNPHAGLQVAGNQVHVQNWGRDQGFAAPCNTTLSDALEYELLP